MKNQYSRVLGVVLFGVSILSTVQGEPLIPDFHGIPEREGWTVVNRGIKIDERDIGTVAEFNIIPGDGAAWLDDFGFNNGIIECDLLGRSEPIQGSFIGLCFRVQNIDTLDAVYFRPFNFRSDDPVRRSHAVQYVSHPDWTWRRLRTEQPGRWEKPINPPPGGDEWFHVRLEIKKPKVRVFVNDADEPCLEVEELSEHTGGSVGLWMGNFSPGSFANLKITPVE